MLLPLLVLSPRSFDHIGGFNLDPKPLHVLSRTVAAIGGLNPNSYVWYVQETFTEEENECFNKFDKEREAASTTMIQSSRACGAGLDDVRARGASSWKDHRPCG